MRPKGSDFILPVFLLLFGVTLFLMAVSRGGWNGTMTLGGGIGALGGFIMWLLSLHATYRRNLLDQNRQSVPKTVNITPILLLTVILISIGNGIIRFSLDVDGQAVVAAFISTFLIGTSLSQFWELWYDWRYQHHRDYE
jgi:hypothetical protein